MSETHVATAAAANGATNGTTPAASRSAAETRGFSDVLKALVGKVVTVVNAESYEHAPMGYQLRAGFYKAKMAGLGEDYLVLMTEFPLKGSEDGKEPVKQFVPLSRVKRISLMKSEMLLHI